MNTQQVQLPAAVVRMTETAANVYATTAADRILVLAGLPGYARSWSKIQLLKRVCPVLGQQSCPSGYLMDVGTVQFFM